MEIVSFYRGDFIRKFTSGREKVAKETGASHHFFLLFRHSLSLVFESPIYDVLCINEVELENDIVEKLNMIF